MLRSYWILFFLLSPSIFAGPLEDLSTMPDLALFHQQLIRQQDLSMILQGMYPAQQFPGANDFTIFAPTNEAMQRMALRMEDPNLLLKYHIVPGRYDDQTLFNMAQEKFNQFNNRQLINGRVQNNLPTVAIPFQLFYGLGFYGGTGPHVNDTTENAGYGSGGISWLTHTSFNQSLSLDSNLPANPFMRNPQAGFQSRSQFGHFQGQFNSFNGNHQQIPTDQSTGNLNMVPQNFSQNSNADPRFAQKQFFPSGGSPYGSWGSNNDIGVLRPTINNAFILQSRPMSRGVINVIDQILWPPERRDQNQIRSAFDVLEEPQFSRLRQLADRSEYFRSELRSNNQQTWFLPNDQAFASMGSTLSYLLDQNSMNNTNDINDFIRAHVLPLVIYPNVMDSTKQIPTLLSNRWITFRKVSQPDQTFQVDVISGRFVGRILVSKSEDIRITGNGVVYPISSILTAPTRSAADELTRGFQYFMNLVQQSGDLELINILQGVTNPNVFNSQPLYNITVLVPQQNSIRQLGSSQDLSINLRRHIIRFPVYVDDVRQNPTGSQSYFQQNFQQGVQQLQPIGSFQQTSGFYKQQQQPQTNANNQQQQPIFNGQQQISQTGFDGQQQQQQQHQSGMNSQIQQLPVFTNPQQAQTNINGQQQRPNFIGQQQQTNFNGLQMQPGLTGQQQQQQQQQQPSGFMQTQYNNQRQENQYQMSQFQRPVTNSVKQMPRRRRQSNPTFQNQPFVSQQYSNQPQMSQQQFQNQPQPPQQQFPNQPQQQFPNQPQVPQQQFPNQPQQQFPNQPQQQFPNQPQQQFPNQPQQQFPNQPQLPQQQYPNQPQILPQQPVPNQYPGQQLPDPNAFGMANNVQQTFFQNGQVYPTMDPQFSIQAQTNMGPNGLVVTLTGRSPNGPSFTATIINSESNIPIRNGVIHVVRGLLAGTALPIESVLPSIQGASTFGQLLQQTGILDQVRQSGRPHTLFVPTNAALQSMNNNYNPTQLKQFVLRHICADVLLDPINNVFRRSAGFYNQDRPGQRMPGRFRQKRQNWMNLQRNNTMFMNQQGMQGHSAYGQPFFQQQLPQQQPQGANYPEGATQYGSNNQFYNPTKTLNNYGPSNPSFGFPLNGTMMQRQQFGNMMPQNSWNTSMNNGPVQRQGPYGTNFPSSNSLYIAGPQSCMSMNGERITVQSLRGTQPEGNAPTMIYQNYIVTCCGDQSINSMVQSYNVYPPNLAVYLIGRPLLSHGQTISSFNNRQSKQSASYLLVIVLLISIVFNIMKNN